MGDPECGAQQPRPLVHRRGHHGAHLLGRRVFGRQAGVAIKHRQRQEGAALMADTAKIAVDDQIEGLLAAIVGMAAPADIGQQAGDMAQPAIFRILVLFGDAHEAVGPIDQLLGVQRRARQQQIEILRGAGQPVLGALLGRQQLIQQAFAHAEGREHDGFRLGDADDVLHHQRRISQQRPPGIGNGLDIGQHIGRRIAAHAAHETERFIGRDRIAVHHLERIFALNDVQPRQRAPGAADRVKGPPAHRHQWFDIEQRLGDDALRALQRFLRGVLQGQRAERQRHALAEPAAAHVDQLQRAAAKVADHAVGLMDPGDHAERRQPRLAFAGQHLDRRPTNPFGAGDEIGAVAGVAAGGGGDGMDLADLHHPDQRAKALERRQRLLDRIVGQ